MNYFEDSTDITTNGLSSPSSLPHNSGDEESPSHTHIEAEESLCTPIANDSPPNTPPHQNGEKSPIPHEEDCLEENELFIDESLPEDKMKLRERTPKIKIPDEDSIGEAVEEKVKKKRGRKPKRKLTDLITPVKSKKILHLEEEDLQSNHSNVETDSNQVKSEDEHDNDNSSNNPSQSSRQCSEDESGGTPMLKKKRLWEVPEEHEIRVPLKHGWRRQTTIRCISKCGVRGEVVYYAPCGKKLKHYPEVTRKYEKMSEDVVVDQVKKLRTIKGSLGGIHRRNYSTPTSSQGDSSSTTTSSASGAKVKGTTTKQFLQKSIASKDALSQKHQQGKEFQRQQMMMAKAIEAQREQEEREKQRRKMMEEIQQKQAMQKEQQELEYIIYKEMQNSVEDMIFKDPLELPNFCPLPSRLLEGPSYSKIMMIFEFLHNFGESIGFESKQLPTLQSLQEGVMNKSEKAEDDLLLLLQHLLVCVIEDPGIPNYPPVSSILKQPLKKTVVATNNISEILRLYLGAHRETCHMLDDVKDLPFLAFSTSLKVDIIEFLCNELLSNDNVVNQIDTSIETVNTLRKNKWVLGSQLRRLYRIKQEKYQLSRGLMEGGGDMYSMFKEEIKKEEEEPIDIADLDIEEDINISEGEEDLQLSQEELSKKIERVRRQQDRCKMKLDQASVRVRVMGFGQDRYRRRYWALPRSGGVLVEGTCSSRFTPEEEAENPHLDNPLHKYPDTLTSSSPSPTKTEVKKEPESQSPVPCDNKSSMPSVADYQNGLFNMNSPFMASFLAGNMLFNPPPMFQVPPNYPPHQSLPPLLQLSPTKSDLLNNKPPTRPWFSILPRTPCDKELELSSPKASPVSPKPSTEVSASSSTATSSDVKAAAATASSSSSSAAQSVPSKEETTEIIPSTSLSSSTTITTSIASSSLTSLSTTITSSDCVTTPSLTSPPLVTPSITITPIPSSTPSSPPPVLPKEKKPITPAINSASILDEVTDLSIPKSSSKKEESHSSNALKSHLPPTTLASNNPNLSASLTANSMFPVGFFFNPLLSSLVPYCQNGSSYLGQPPSLPPTSQHTSTKTSSSSSSASKKPIVTAAEKRKIILERLHQYEKPLDIPKEFEKFWWFVKDGNQLKHAVESLLVRGVRESTLFRNLRKHFTYCLSICPPSPKVEEETQNSAALSILNNNSKEEKDVKPELAEDEPDNKKPVKENGVKKESNKDDDEEEEEEEMEIDEDVKPTLSESLTEEERSIQIAIRVDMSVLEQVEALEEQVAGASMQIKEWQLPPRFSSDKKLNFIPAYLWVEPANEFDINPVYAARDKLIKLEPAIEKRYIKPPLGYNTDVKLSSHLANGHHSSHAHPLPYSSSRSRSGAFEPLPVTDTPPAPSEEEPMEIEEEETAIPHRKLPQGLVIWREALRNCDTSAKVATCLNQLESCIAWDKSVMKASCQFCCSDDNEDMLLLCDSCDKGFHTYCFKPELQNIPDGDWYCPVCLNKGREEKLCVLCFKVGKFLTCETCPKTFHLLCLDPPLTRMPKGKWQCNSCSKGFFQLPTTTKKKGSLSMTPSFKLQQIPSSPSKTTPASTESKTPDTNNTTTTPTSTSSSSKRANRSNQSSAKKTLLEKDLAFCRRLMKEMERHEDAWPFREPVNTKEVPMYRKVVKKPMDLSTIKTKLTNKNYASPEEFVGDVTLIFDNCEAFNEDDSDIGQAGHSMRAFFEKKWGELSAGQS